MIINWFSFGDDDELFDYEPFGKAYNNFWNGKPNAKDLNLYDDFVWSRKSGNYDGYLKMVEGVAKELLENPTYDSWKRVIPRWGFAMQAYLDCSVGKWGWGTFNSVMAILDVFLYKPLFTAEWKTGFTAMTKDYKWWSSWRRCTAGLWMLWI
jgi:hypothetical protein